MNEFLCPLLSIAASNSGYARESPCIGLRCAWWNATGCTLADLATALPRLAEAVEDLAAALSQRPATGKD